MVQSILKHLVTFAQQAGEDPGIGHVPAGVEQGTRPSGKFCESLFQLMMRRTVTTDKVRSPTAHAIASSGLLETSNNPGMSRQAQIVIATKVEIVPALQSHNWALSGIQGQALTIKPLLLALCKARAQPLFEAHHVTNQADAAS